MMDDIAEQQDVAKEISEAISNPVAFGGVSAHFFHCISSKGTESYLYLNIGLAIFALTISFGANQIFIKKKPALSF